MLKPLNPSDLTPALNPVLVTDGAGLLKVSDYIQRVDVAAFDFETNVVKHFTDRKIRLIQIGDRNEQYLIDLLHFTDGNSDQLIAEQGFDGKHLKMLQPVADVLRPFLDSRHHLKVGMYLQFEYEMSRWNLGIRMHNVYSIELADKVLEAGVLPFNFKGVFSMEGIVARRLGFEIDKSAQTTFNLTDPLTDDQITYAALDLRLPLAVRQVQLPLLAKERLERAARIENEALPAFGELHLNGVRLDCEKWQALIDAKRLEHKKNIEVLDSFFIPKVGRKSHTQETVDALEAKYESLKLFSQAELDIREDIKNAPDRATKDTLRVKKGQLLLERNALRATVREEWYKARRELKEYPDFEGEALINYGSAKQLLEALVLFKGINRVVLPDTNDKSLDKLADKHPVIAAIQEFRSTDKYLTTYAEEWYKHINPVTGNIHSDIRQMGAETGRASSTKPNLFNLDNDGKVRAAFVCPPGYSFITMDMQGAELRLLAEDSREPIWIEAFKKKKDVHSISTEILYSEEWKRDALPNCAYYMLKNKEIEQDEVAFKKFLKSIEYELEDWERVQYGEMLKAKCKCPGHKERRDPTKSATFLLMYRGKARSLAAKIRKPVPFCEELMKRHARAFPTTWAFLDKIAAAAKINLEARSVSGRRRKFKRPEYEEAKQKLIEEYAKKKIQKHPTSSDISKKMAAMYGSIEREGTNHPYQGGNADVAKTAMGAGYCKEGKPFMWHLLPQYGAKLSNFLYDEFNVWVPTENAEACADMMADCVRRGGAEFMNEVVMEPGRNIGYCWAK